MLCNGYGLFSPYRAGVPGILVWHQFTSSHGCTCTGRCADSDGISYYVVGAYAQTTGGELIVAHASEAIVIG